MSFLTLSGFALPVLATSGGTVNIVNVGEYGRAFSGVPYSAVRARGDEYSGRWPAVARTTSRMYSMILLGQGDSWRFATSGIEQYSSKGLGPTSTTGTPAYSATSGPVNSGPRLLLDSGEGMSYDLDVAALNQEATLSLWLKSASTSNTWKHYVIEADGGGVLAGWQNGVSVSVGTLPDSLGDEWFTFNGLFPTVNLGNSGLADEAMQIAEVMLFPFRASALDSAWPAWPYNSGSGRAAEDFPYLTMGGTWPAAGSDTVLGELGQESLVDVGSSLYSARDFTLRSRS